MISLALTLAWLVLQLVGYVLAMVAIVAAFAAVLLVPWYYAGRFVWQRLRA